MVAYHTASADPFYSSEGNSRAYSYYGIPGTPYVIYDGWGNQGAPSYADSRWFFDTLQFVAPTPKVTIDLAGTFYNSGTKTGTVKAHIVNVSGGSLSGVVHVLITETNLSYGGSTYYDVVRDMVTGTSGTTKNLASGASTDVTQAFTIGGSWNSNNCRIVVWYQKTSGKGVQVCQGAKVALMSVAVEENAGLKNVELKAMPNPVVSRANISYTLKDKSEISLNVYDVSGKLVRTLEQGVYGAGTRTINWDTRDNNGREVSAGKYFCKLTIGNESVLTKTLTVL